MADPTPLAERYWFIEGNEAKFVDVPTPRFWDQLMTGDYVDDDVKRVAVADGWLVTAFEMTSDMNGSEMHPEGDELHYLVSGRLDLVLEKDDGDRILELTPGTSAAVPKGVWHRFIVREPGRGISMTFGRGTEHRPLRD